MILMKMPKIVLAASCASLALALSACSGDTQGSSTNANADNAGRIAVATSFYPVTWLTEQIGGDKVTVTSMTPSNVEPHDFELAPVDIATMTDADVVIYVRGFQPSFDDAVAAISGPTIIDLSDAVDLRPLEAGSEDEPASEYADSDEPDNLDPHFWLDPVRMESAAKGIEQALSEADSGSAALFADSLAAIETELASLDSSYTSGLATCERNTIVTGHSAFSYLASEYGLSQTSISGIDPDREPSPAEISRVKKVIEETGTTTVFTEELVSPKTAQALATEAGAQVEVLATLEGQPEQGDYLSAMKDNLEALRTALGCK